MYWVSYLIEIVFKKRFWLSDRSGDRYSNPGHILDVSDHEDQLTRLNLNVKSNFQKFQTWRISKDLDYRLLWVSATWNFQIEISKIQTWSIKCNFIIAKGIEIDWRSTIGRDISLIWKLHRLILNSRVYKSFMKKPVTT